MAIAIAVTLWYNNKVSDSHVAASQGLRKTPSRNDTIMCELAKGSSERLNPCSTLSKASSGENLTGWNSMSFEYVIDSSARMEYIGGTSKNCNQDHRGRNSHLYSRDSQLADKFEQMNKPFADHLNFIRSRVMPIDPAIAFTPPNSKRIRKYSTI